MASLLVRPGLKSLCRHMGGCSSGPAGQEGGSKEAVFPFIFVDRIKNTHVNAVCGIVSKQHPEYICISACPSTEEKTQNKQMWGNYYKEIFFSLYCIQNTLYKFSTAERVSEGKKERKTGINMLQLGSIYYYTGVFI